MISRRLCAAQAAQTCTGQSRVPWCAQLRQSLLQSVCMLCPCQRAVPPKEVWEENHTHLKVWDAVSLPQRHLKHI